MPKLQRHWLKASDETTSIYKDLFFGVEIAIDPTISHVWCIFMAMTQTANNYQQVNELWMSNHMPCKSKDEIINPFPNLTSLKFGHG